jgi:hypothetical protein
VKDLPIRGKKKRNKRQAFFDGCRQLELRIKVDLFVQKFAYPAFSTQSQFSERLGLCLERAKRDPVLFPGQFGGRMDGAQIG